MCSDLVCILSIENVKTLISIIYVSVLPAGSVAYGYPSSYQSKEPGSRVYLNGTNGGLSLPPNQYLLENGASKLPDKSSNPVVYQCDPGGYHNSSACFIT